MQHHCVHRICVGFGTYFPLLSRYLFLCIHTLEKQDEAASLNLLVKAAMVRGI